MIKIHDLKPAKGSTKAKRRVGRGIAGKGGKTAGRGTKGQHARNTVARGFENRARRTTSDNAGTRRSGLEQHASGIVAPRDRVGNRGTGERNRIHALLRFLDAFLDRSRYLFGFAVSEAYFAVAIANDHQCCEGKAAPAFHHFRDSVDRDDALVKLTISHAQNSNPASRAPSATAATRPWYLKPPRSNTTELIPAAFARSPTNLPTSRAASTVPVLPLRSATSIVEAAAIVDREISSIACT